MDKKTFYEYALQRVPVGKHIVAIDFHALENRYVAILANEGETYPFTGKIYEPKESRVPSGGYHGHEIISNY